jgi:hypothetical protein
MTKRIGGAMVAAALMFGGSVAIHSAVAAPLRAAVHKQLTSKASDLGARRRVRHHHRDVNRATYYYDRPHYYTPAPFFPFLGLGYGPWW